jgi:Putative adhesin
VQKSFEVTGPVRLDVHLSSGLIEVEPTLEGRVEVELIAHDSESQQLVDAARVELRGSGDRQEVVIDVPARPKSWSLGNLLGRQTISCRIQCPAGSDLKARSKSADIRVRGTLGEVDVSTASGDVVVVDTLGDVSIKSASGDLSAGSVGGRATANTASGDVRIESVAGAVVANTASGDVEIASAGSDVRANTASGDTNIGAVVSGSVVVNAASGDVRIGVRRGSRVHLDCSTVSGDARSELELGTDEPEGDGPFVEVKARTASGDITVTRAPALAEAQEVNA